jgi:hypothetical protein
MPDVDRPALLSGALTPFINSASAWLIAPFAVGACMATRRGGASAGLAVCTLELVGYYVTAHAAIGLRRRERLFAIEQEPQLAKGRV